MSKPLIIVESPAKVRTIKKYAGDQYNVAATVGHILDLPQKELGIDIENGFTPKYGEKYELIFPTMVVELDMDPEDDKIKQDEYILTGVDKDTKEVRYKKTLTVDEDKDDDVGFIELHFKGTAKDLLYTLEVDPGEDEDEDGNELKKTELFKEIGYDQSF